MKNVIRKGISICVAITIFTSLLIFLPTKADVSYAVESVTIVGTVENTRSYYNVNGPVTAYCFFPSTLTTYKYGGKQVEITEFGAGVNPAILGTNDLSSYVGKTMAYTGVIGKTDTAPFTYTFCIESATDAAPVSMAEMNAYLTGLGFSTTPTEVPDSGEYYIGCLGWNNTVAFSYHTKGSCVGEITAYILHEDFSPDFGIDTYRIASNAKAMQAAKKLAQYGNGELSREKLQKYLDSL